MSDLSQEVSSDTEIVTEKTVLDLTATPCGICGPSTCDEEMIGCDGCVLWFHSRCVGLAEGRKPQKWYCQAQACQTLALQYQQQQKEARKATRSRKITDESDKSGVTSRKGISSTQQRIKALEEKQKRQEEELEAEMLLQQRERKMQRLLEMKKMELELKMQTEEEEEQKAFQARILQQRKSQVERMRANQESFKKQMADLDQEMKELSNMHVPEFSPGIVDKANTSKTRIQLKQSEVTRDKPIEDEYETDEEEDDEDFDDDLDQKSLKSNSMSKTTIQASTPLKLELNGEEKIFHGLEQKRIGPTKAQLAARRGFTYKLRKFSGKAIEWPLFYASYTASNEACGYMDHENLIRLQECLEGNALELVSGQLLLPESVPKVIEKLRRHFGRPEQILKSLLDKVENLKAPQPDDLQSFVPFANAVEQLCSHLEAAGLRQHLENPLLIKNLIKKIPDREKRDWVRYQRAKSAGEPTLRTLTDWLMEFDEDACAADIEVNFNLTQARANSKTATKRLKERGSLFSHSEMPNTGPSTNERNQFKHCKACHSTDHRLRFCEDFQKLTYADRQKLVNREKLCLICLNGHGGRCRFKIRCNVGDCRDPHHPLMHPIGGAVGMSAHIRSNSRILFRMVPVQLHCGSKSITVLAFLDEGASVTLVEQNLADRLGVLGVQERLTIKWTADVVREEKESRKMNLWASCIGNGVGNKLLLHSVRTVSKLKLPRQKLDFPELAAQYAHMRELAIESYDGQPELLIGLNNIHSFAPIEAKMGSPVEPIAVRCKLGWTVYGPKHSTTVSACNYLGHHQEISNEDLHELLKSHYALDESVTIVPQESPENKRAREILERTTKRIGDWFETGLLWKTDNPSFPKSFPTAVRRLQQLERRFNRDLELKSNVYRQIEEYQLKGYAHLATAEELNNTAQDKVWYLPLNVVQNPKKPGKVRLVWDAAASVQGVSLNSQLLKGPDMLVPLVRVIIGFRERRIAFGGDLKEMFHQLKIRAADKQAQRFVFRTNPEVSPSVYVMDVATFGSTCSPCSAQFVKNRNAEEFAVQYPEAAAAIIYRHYVDDYFDSVDTVEEAVKLAREVRLVHQKGGFEIRNWVSNSPEVLQAMGEEKPAEPVHFNQDKQTYKERVLGVIWYPDVDEFAFSAMHREDLLKYLYEDKRPTKRLVASCVMGFFDPLGLLSPFTIHGKILIQHLWRSNCDWDEQIDLNCWNLWKRWTSLLPEIEAIRIPRCYLGNTKSTEVDSMEIHIFTDASEHAYGCVAYLRVTIGDDVHCSLVMSRAKVAPLKRQSIPRLELMGAVLGARMSQTVLNMHSYKFLRTVFWTDSRTVCSWLHSDQHRYKQFVAFRIGEIWELTKASDWRWVPTKLNIADVLTKWGQGPPLQSDGEWFKGPTFLYRPQNKWPSKETTFEETDEDIRGVVMFHDIIEVERVSRWSKLLRVLASVVRFIANCRRKQKGEPILTSQATEKQLQMIEAMAVRYTAVQTPLNQQELQRAETILWRQAQWESYPDEMSILKNNTALPGQVRENVKKNSPIYKCSPIIDEKGVLRMDSRLANDKEGPFDKRFPIILSRSHNITQKLIKHYHEEFGHANSETVFNEMRQRFQIPKLRSAIQHEVGRCVWCKVHKCHPSTPRMAPLPVERVTSQLRPFSSIGIDYLGPIEVTVGRRKEKRWVAVITCLSVRAVCFEIVHSLSTESCRMAISRFCSKFGKPNNIFSDNATCFRGANNEMVRMQKINQKCAESIVSSTTAWHFNPPGTPHMGGIWERMVRSAKEAMRALDDGRKLTDEILATTMAEAADMINTRPLTYLPQESEEKEALTPNHFLRGTVTCADTKTDKPTELAEALRNMYKRSQYLADKMWERWSKEYLPTINQRSKWFEDQKPLKRNDLVFVVDGKNRKSWKRGIVEAVIEGSDGRIRQVDVRTADGNVQRRGVVNLALIEIQ